VANYKDFKDSLNLDNIISLNQKIEDEVKKNNEINLKKELDETEIKELISNKANVYYADCESFVYNGEHKIYMLGYVSDLNDDVIIENTVDNKPENVILNFLDYITKDYTDEVIVYFHNVKYDFHILLPYLNVVSTVEKDNQFYSISIKYKNKKILFKDSYKLLSMKLSDFNNNFNLPEELNKLEAIAYKYYTPHNHNKLCKKSIYKKFLPLDKKKILYDNIKSKVFNPYEYYEEYLKLDCLVLKKGFQRFREVVIRDIDYRLDIHNFLTISSLTDRYMKINGAFKDVYPVQGVLRNYINQAIRGGRVSVNEKYIKQVILEKIADFDGVSLYPSAIHRLCQERGLPKGVATRFKKKELSKWADKDYCILTIKINKVNKIQQMPFISYKDKKGILQYTNTPPDDVLIIDKYTLEDYIEFHKIEYDILDGVYWNQGFNKTMGNLIQNLFQVRLKNKKSNPALANVLKLMLNSSYGKTIMKQSFDKKIYKNNRDKTKLNNYIYNNYETIKKIDKLNDFTTMIKMNTFDDSLNYGHVGCSILSYSKRIMNEVFDIANDNDIPIYYTDTDSIHMPYNKINKLTEAYNIKYNKELQGKNLGQFHNDFDMPDACSDIYATKSLFLGKKCYIDCLESTDKAGNKINGYHFRMKGVSLEGLHHEVNKNKKFNNMFDLYKYLADDNKLKIILNPVVDDVDQKVMFEYDKNKVFTRSEFIREIKF
jgi:hypothetical protein